MPRVSREQSSTGIYHVMSRGVEKRQIFLDQKDYRRYLAILAEGKRRFGFALYAWCLMPNHVHLLIQDNNGNLSDALKYVNGTYALYFNERYGRVGPLFQSRFKSCPVEDEGYLIAVVAYIHDNPAKAGLGTRLSYPWSSYRDYASASPQRLTDVAFVQELLGDGEGSIEIDRLQYLPAYFNDEGLLNPHLAVDADIALVLMGYEGVDFLECPKSVRNSAIQQLRRQGYSFRDIEGATGVSRSTASRICRSK